MRIEVKYGELSQWLQKKYGRNISFEPVDSRSVAISTSVKKLMVTLPVKMTLRVESVANDEVRLSSGGGLGWDMVLLVVGSFLKSQSDDVDKMVHRTDNRTFTVNLCEAEQLRGVLRTLRLTDLKFERNDIVLDLELRN